MASWDFACKKCDKAFTFSPIRESLTDYFMPLKPEMPPQGVERECPHCKTISSYQRPDLIYQSGEKSRGHGAGC